MWLLIAVACHEPADESESDTGAAPDVPVVVVDADGDGASADADCNDRDARIHPGAAEECDAVDQDCDGLFDEDAIGERVAFADDDADGYGSPADWSAACVPPSGYIATGGDCLDDDPTVHPAAVEVCGDGIDQDCDGADEACSHPAPDELFTSHADASWSGADVRALGATMAAADLDGDGADDLLVSGYQDTSAHGVVTVAYGGPRAGAYFVDDEAYWVLESTNGGAALGGLGDLDGDGYDEVAVADAYGDGFVVYGGATRVTAGTPLSSDADALFESAQVLRAGDLDGDGLDDAAALSGASLALVSGSSSRLSGTVSVASAPTWTGTADEDLGGLVAGDFDGDGRDDLAVAATDDTDASTSTVLQTWYVWPGSTGGYSGVQVVTDAPGGARITTESSPVGHNRGNAGDVNGDGFDDLAATWEGSWVFFGGSTGFEGVRSESEADVSLHYGVWEGPYMGDLTGDGVADLVVTAPGFNDPYDDAGAVFGLPGAPDLTGRWYPSDVPMLIRGEGRETKAGIAIIMEPTDLDADGVDDLLFGSNWADSFRGRAWAFFRPFDG
jgi:hypothetical protein